MNDWGTYGGPISHPDELRRENLSAKQQKDLYDLEYLHAVNLESLLLTFGDTYQRWRWDAYNNRVYYLWEYPERTSNWG